MFKKLKEINNKPEPFEFYTTDQLWTNDHTSKKMLEYHLNQNIEASSRNFKFIDRSVEWIIDKFNLDANSTVLDLGCGPGFYVKRFGENNIKATGVDFSKRSIDYAKKRDSNEKLDVEYINENYFDYDTEEKFDLIIMIMCDFSTFNSDKVELILSKMKKFLKPEGRILLDVYSEDYFENFEEDMNYYFNYMDNFWSPDDYYCFVNKFKYEDDKVLLDKYTVVEESNSFEIYNWIKCYSKESILETFETNGFEIEDYYKNVAGEKFYEDHNEFAIVARHKE